MSATAEPDEFEAIVADAVDSLPPEFASQIRNLEFAVEEWAQPGDLARMGLPPGATLLGIYRGVPLTRRGAHYNFTLPDRIVIFRGPLLALSRDEPDLVRRVHHVVRHEVAHYFGISDERLRELDAY
ncbi:MAG: metallopeptidase family protein [Chloroflexi bacterium]|nr:metallopeptidase family protein [Chloroflexota bacterium]